MGQPTLIEDSALTYSGPWNTSFDASYSMHSRHDSDNTATANATATWSGYFTDVDIIATTSFNFGQADIYVDGALHGTADYYAATLTQQQVVYSITGLTPDYHTVEIKKKGTKNSSSTSYYITIDYLNATLVRPTKTIFNNILCIGDSITFGINVSTRPGNLYGYRLRDMLYLPVTEIGMSSDQIQDITDRLDAIAKPRKPDLICWLAGMNDPSPQTPMEAGIDKIWSLLPNAEVILSTIEYNTYHTSTDNSTRVSEVQNAATAKDVLCCDLWDATNGNTYVTSPQNTVHPNDDCHGLIAALFYNEIMKYYTGEKSLRTS